MIKPTNIVENKNKEQTMKKISVVTKMTDPVTETTLEINIFEDLGEAVEKLGSEGILDIVNHELITRERTKWRQNKFKEYYPAKAKWSLNKPRTKNE